MSCRSVSSRTVSVGSDWSSTDGPPYFSETEHACASRSTSLQVTRTNIDALSGAKKQKMLIPGLNGTYIDPDEPCDVCMEMYQYPEMLARYRIGIGQRTSWLIPFASYAHAQTRDLSFVKLVKLVADHREAYDRATFYYPDEIERLEQWSRFLELQEAGAAQDSDVYRLRLIKMTPMVLPPYKGVNTRKSGKIAEEARYQTLYTDGFWNDEQRQSFVLISQLPAHPTLVGVD